jgi:hypothetical protein
MLKRDEDYLQILGWRRQAGNLKENHQALLWRKSRMFVLEKSYLKMTDLEQNKDELALL